MNITFLLNQVPFKAYHVLNSLFIQQTNRDAKISFDEDGTRTLLLSARVITEIMPDIYRNLRQSRDFISYSCVLIMNTDGP